MKAVILLSLTTVLTFAALAQQVPPQTSLPPPTPHLPHTDRNETIRRNRLLPPRPSGFPGAAQRGARLDIRTLTTPRLLTGFIRSNQSPKLHAPTQPQQPESITPSRQARTPIPARQAAAKSTERSLSTPAQIRASTKSRPLGATCNNKSFFQIIGLTHGVVYAGAMTHTQDDGVVISGTVWDSTAAHPSWQINAYVLKCDNLGNILWINLLVDPANDPIYGFYPMLIKEMSGGDLLLAASLDDDPSGKGDKFVFLI